MKSSNPRKKTTILTFLVLLGLLTQSFKVKGVATDQPQALEGRGIWVHPYYFSSDPVKGTAEIKRNFTVYKALNLNLIFFLVKDPRSYVYYDSLNPVNPDYGWDPLHVAIQEAHKLGLELHAWFCVFPEEGENHGLLWERPDLAMVDIDGNRVAWACPAKQDARDYELSLILECATKYAVDGIHLDYIRYPHSRVCYCDHCRLEFSAQYGFDPGAKPDDPRWISWKIAQISSFVNETYTKIKQIKPQIKVSAAVFRGIESAKSGVYQDWGDWIEKGSLDFVAPMIYTPSVEEFRASIDAIVKTVQWKCPVYAGIGLHRLTEATTLLEQVEASKCWGVQGQILFCCHWLNEEFTEALNREPYSEPATVPHQNTETKNLALAQGQARHEATTYMFEKANQELARVKGNFQRTSSILEVWAIAATLCTIYFILGHFVGKRRKEFQ